MGKTPKKAALATHKTDKEGTAEGKRKVAQVETKTVDPAKPAGITYQALNKDATHGASFTYEWTLGECFNKSCTQYHVSITTKNWVSTNIVSISVPEIGLSGRFHKLIAPQFIAFFKASASKAILPITSAGTFVARTITNNSAKLSNHALGTAIDLNSLKNPYKGPQADRGVAGSLAEMADICADFGIYWGGWYSKSADPMHFEAVKVMDEADLKAKCEAHGVDWNDTQV